MTNPIYYNRVVTSTVQGDGYNVIEPNGTLVVANGGELRLHDGSTAGGNAVSGGGGSGSTGNFTFNGNGVGNSSGDITIAPGWDGQFTGNTYIVLPTNDNASGEALQVVNNNTGGVQVITYNGATWTFGSDGSLTLPQSNSGAALLTAGANGLQVLANTHDWDFGTDGTLTIPGAIKSSSTPQVGLQLSTGEPNFGYGGIRACFNTNTFTGGSFSDIQVGWIVGGPNGFTDIISALNDVGSGFITLTNNSWPGQGPYTFSSPDYSPAVPHNIVVESNTSTWIFGTDGSLSFPDLSKQTFAPSVGVGPLHPYAAPFPSSTVIGTDYQFYFDIGNNGYPSMQSYAPTGGNPLYNSIWSVEFWTAASSSANPAVSSSGPTPVQVNNTGGVLLVPATLAPGDYAVVRIQNIDTGKVYRATFLGSYNAADEGNETKYGSIIVERLV